MIISKQLQGGSSAPTLELEVSYGNYEIASNRTPISYVFRIKRPSNIESQQTKDYTINIGGNVIEGSTLVGGTGTKTIKSGSLYITHNEDGTKKFNISFSINIAITWSGTYNGIISTSGTMTLPTIPRATTPTLVDSATLGDTITISTPRKVNTFKHNLYLIIGNSEVTIANNVATSYQWTIPKNIATHITTSKRAIGKVVCETYDGNTYIGKASVNLTLIVPTDIVPTINSVVVTDDIGLNGYVEGKSKLDVTINASGIYGSTIKDVTSKLNSVIYKGSQFTTEPLNFHTKKVIKTKVTDSRGYYVEVETDITPMEYNAPKITNFKVQRCDQDGVISDEGTYLKIDYGFAISPLNNQNNKKVSFYYETISSFGTFKEITNKYADSGSFITDDEFSTDISYTLRMSVEDTFTNNKAYRDLPTEKVTLDIRASGRGMALGKIAEEDDLLDIAWNVKFKDDKAWTPLTLTSNFKPYDDDLENTPKYRVRDKIVEIRGAISPTTAHMTSNTRETIATLPVGLRPSDDIYKVCQGSGKNTWLFSVQPNGDITFSRYGTTEFANVPNTAWLVFQITYLI